MTHTPGPYWIMPTDDGGQCIMGTINGMEHAVAECHSGMSNALLLLAAPDLLAACKAIIKWADKECMPQGVRNDGPWEIVEAAIARARGT